MTKTGKSVFRGATLTASLLVLVVGLIVADTATRQHKFVGQLRIICDQQGQENPANPADALLLTNIVIPFNVVDLATSNQVSSSFSWDGSSAKKRTFSWHLAGPGTADANPVTGKISLNLPFEATFGGKKYRVPLVLTTESSTDGYGSANGTRASANQLGSRVVLIGGTTIQGDAKDFGLEGLHGKVPLSFRIICDGHFESTGGLF